MKPVVVAPRCPWPRRKVLVKLVSPAWDVIPARYDVIKWKAYYVKGQWVWKRTK